MASLLLTLVAGYAIFLILMFAFQRRLIYIPDKIIQPPEAYGLRGFSEYFTSAKDGISIQIWHRPAAPGFPTIVYYHGNASHMGNRADILSALAGKGFGALAVSYRGYGKSGGTPSERGIYADARAAIAFAQEKFGVPVGRIMLYGESLGTGVAVQMATEYDVGALILQAPYKSVAGRAAEIYYYIPVKLLIRDKYDSLSKIARVKAPLLHFHGELDVTIPIAHGKALFAAAREPKQAFFFPDRSHNDFDSAVISAHVLDFARKHGLVN